MSRKNLTVAKAEKRWKLFKQIEIKPVNRCTKAIIINLHNKSNYLCRCDYFFGLANHLVWRTFDNLSLSKFGFNFFSLERRTFFRKDMIPRIVLSTVFTLFFCRCLGSDQLYREAQGSVTYDRALVGFVIARFETRGFLSCAHKCLSHPSCKSYNFHGTAKERGFCEINSDQGDLEGNFISQPGNLFGRLKRQEVGEIY